MRRLTAAVLLLAACGCSRYRPPIQTDETQNRPVASAIEMADKQHEFQLLSGFHQVEDWSWRWTKGRFALALRPPPSAAQRGARLELALTLPEALTSRRRSIAISGSADGVPLAPQKFSQSGDALYSAEVPLAVLASGPVKFEFAVAGFFRAGEVDGRELGVIVRRAALVAR